MHKEVKPLSSDVEKIVDGPSYPLELLTTKFGSMKLALLGHCYEFHFNRKGYKFWKCLNHTKGCEARAVSRDNSVYPMDSNHNHDQDATLRDAAPFTMVSKRNKPTVSVPQIVSIESAASVPLKVGPPVTLRPASAVVSTGNKATLDNDQLKNKMKQRLAALGVNLTTVKKEE